MAILGWRKQLLKISMNFILMRIPAMILAQHANEDEDMDMDMDVVAEEEELQALTSIKWTRHQEEIVLKLSHHVTRQCNPDLRCKLSHHVTKQCNSNLRCKLSHNVTRQCNPWYHPGSSPSCTNPSTPSPSCTTPSGHTHRYG